MAAEKMRVVNRGLITAGSGVNFMEFIESTYTPTTLPLLAKGVQKTYRGMIHKYLEPAFSNLTLRDLTPLTMQQFFSAMPARGILHPTMVKVWDALSSVVRSAVRFQFLDTNPLEKVQLPRDKRGKPPKPVISPAGFKALLSLIPEPYATVVYVDVYSGVRAGELAALKWRDIGDGSITIRASYSRGTWSCTKTSAGTRTVAVEPHVIERIHRLKNLTVDTRAGRAVRHHKIVKADGPGDLVFQSVRLGTEINMDNIRKRYLQSAADKLGLGRIDFRCLRRSCATWQLLAGADPKSVTGQMGHSRTSTTMEIYAQFVPESQRRAAARLSEYVAEEIKKAAGPSWSNLVQ
jgi:integrase